MPVEIKQAGAQQIHEVSDQSYIGSSYRHVSKIAFFFFSSTQKASRNYFAVQPHYRLCLGDMPFVAGKVSWLNFEFFCTTQIFELNPLICLYTYKW